MAYLGQVDRKASNIQVFNVASSTSATHNIGWTPPSEQTIIVTINGVKQHTNAYSFSGAVLTLSSALVTTDELEVIGINDIGNSLTPVDGSVTTSKLGDDAVTLAKMAALARGKIIVGDSSGDPSALTVGSANQVLKSDGTDVSWGTDVGGKILQVVSTSYSTQETTTSGTLSNTSLAVAITPASASNKVLILLSVPLKSGRNSSFTATSFEAMMVAITRGVTEVYVNHGLGVGANFTGGTGYLESNWSIAYLDSPSTTSATTYTFQISSTRTDFTTTSCQGDKLGNIIAMEIAA